MKAIYLILLFTVLSSCFKQNKTQAVPQKYKPLSAISSFKKMIKIEGGSYKAFIGKDSGRVVKVNTFLMDDSPVTNAEYLQFLKANPQWTRSKVIRLYADSTYLHNWKGDFQLPTGISPEAPVTNVSWFAAEAYAKSAGKRLPTIDEWEYAGVADEISPNASEKPEFTEFILKAYQQKEGYHTPVKQHKPNYYGLYDMYGKVWEWTYDFNSVMMSGESRKDNTTNESLFCAGAAVTSSDLRNYAAFMRFAIRGSLKANYCVNNLGFRCVKDFKK